MTRTWSDWLVLVLIQTGPSLVSQSLSVAIPITFDSYLKAAQTAKSNYVNAVAKLSDWLKNVAPVLLTKEKENQKQSHLVRAIFSAH